MTGLRNKMLKKQLPGHAYVKQSESDSKRDKERAIER